MATLAYYTIDTEKDSTTLGWPGLVPQFSYAMSSFSNNIFSFCRSGEITVENEKEYDLQLHLSFSDVTVDNAESLKVISVNIKP